VAAAGRDPVPLPQAHPHGARAAPPGRDPVLLLHGQPGSARDWERVLASIGERARTIAIDRPGWDGHNAATDLRGNSAAALVALDAAGAERATVVGHSFGGGVAAWLAAHYPERVGALVLVAPSANAASLNRLDRWLAKPVLGELACATMLGAAGVLLSAAAVRRRLARELAIGDGYLQSSARRLLTPSAWHAFTFEQRALVRDLPALEPALGRISAPTTIVAGARDLVVPLSSLRKLAAQIPHSELRMIERAGHLLPLRRAQLLAEIILAAPNGR
jgi:pimeloyl-ACP methyl ester carboxylesterase